MDVTPAPAPVAERPPDPVAQRKQALESGQIKCGQAIYLGGNDFDFVTLEEYSGRKRESS